MALNIDQVKQYGPPPNPAKETDSRFASYGNQYGSDCWELDALDPAVIADLVRTEVQAMIDPSTWRKAQAREEVNRGILARASEN